MHWTIICFVSQTTKKNYLFCLPDGAEIIDFCCLPVDADKLSLFLSPRRRRKRRHEQKEGTPLLDELGNGGLEEGEIGNETPTTAGHVAWPPAYGPPPSRTIPPSPLSVTSRPPAGGTIPFVDTSVPPPILGGSYATPPLYSLNQPPPLAGAYHPPQVRTQPPPTGRYDAYSATAAYPPLVPPAPPPPVPILNPDLAAPYGGPMSHPPPVGPMGDHAGDKYSGRSGGGRREDKSYSREGDRYSA